MTREVPVFKRIGAVLLTLALLVGMLSVMGAFPETVAQTETVKKFTADFSTLTAGAVSAKADVEYLTSKFHFWYAQEAGLLIQRPDVNGYFEDADGNSINEALTSDITVYDPMTGASVGSSMWIDGIGTKASARGVATWTVTDGMLSCNATYSESAKYRRINQMSVLDAYGKAATLKNFELSMDFQLLNTLNYDAGLLSVSFRAQSEAMNGVNNSATENIEGDRLFVALSPKSGRYFIGDPTDAEAYTNHLKMNTNASSSTSLSSNLTINTTYTMKLRVVGQKIEMSIYDAEGNAAADTVTATTTWDKEGYLVLGSCGNGAAFANIEVTRLDDNGKAVDFDVEKFTADFSTLTAGAVSAAADVQYLTSKFDFWYAQEALLIQRPGVNGYFEDADGNSINEALTSDIMVYDPMTGASVGSSTWIDGIGTKASAKGVATWTVSDDGMLYNTATYSESVKYRRYNQMTVLNADGEAASLKNFELSMDFKLIDPSNYENSFLTVAFRAATEATNGGFNDRAVVSFSPKKGRYFIGGPEADGYADHASMVNGSSSATTLTTALTVTDIYTLKLRVVGGDIEVTVYNADGSVAVDTITTTTTWTDAGYLTIGGSGAGAYYDNIEITRLDDNGKAVDFDVEKFTADFSDLTAGAVAEDADVEYLASKFHFWYAQEAGLLIRRPKVNGYFMDASGTSINTALTSDVTVYDPGTGAKVGFSTWLDGIGTKASARGVATWTVTDGMLSCDANYTETSKYRRINQMSVLDANGKSASLKNFELSMDFQLLNSGNYDTGLLSVSFRAQSEAMNGVNNSATENIEGDRLFITLSPKSGRYFIGDPTDAEAYTNHLKMNTSASSSTSLSSNLTINTTYTMKLRVVGENIEMSIYDAEGNAVADTVTATTTWDKEGYLVLGSSCNGASFANIEVTRLDDNGKAVDFTVAVDESEDIASGMTFAMDPYYRVNGLFDEVITAFEAELYFPADFTGRGGVILGNYGSKGKCANFEITANGCPRIYYANGTIDITFDQVNVYTGEIVNLKIANTGGTFICFVDGEMQQTITVSSDAWSNAMIDPLILGGDLRNTNNQYFKGTLLSAAVYSDSGKMASWDLRDKSGAEVVSDETGAGYDLELYANWMDTDEKTPVMTLDDNYTYSMVLVGDTQIVTEYDVNNGTAHLNSIYDWIVANKETRNIQYVMGLGDITDNNTDAEWTYAVEQIRKMDGVVPYSLIRGNHDGLGTDTQFNTYLDQEFYNTTYEGSFDGTALNTWRTLTVGDIRYLIMALDYGASDEVLSWASDVIEAHPYYNVIITTHAYLYRDGTTLDQSDTCPPATTGGHNNGDHMWDKLISQHENIVLVVSGHDPSDNVIMTQTEGKNGNVVTQMLVDPQNVDVVNGPTGMVAVLYFSADGKTVNVEQYSTVRDQYFEQDSQFEMELNVIEYRGEATVSQDGIITVSPADGYELKAGSLLAADANGDVYVPQCIGFRNGGDASQYEVSGGTAPYTLSYEFIKPTLDAADDSDGPNIGNIGTSYNTQLNGLRFVSRFTRKVIDGTEYVVIDGVKYEIKDYGLLLSSEPGLNTTEASTDEDMQIGSGNQYVQKLSIVNANKYYDICDDHVDMSVCIVNIDKVAGYTADEAAQIEFYARPYVIVNVNGAQTVLYGECFSSNYHDVTVTRTTATVVALNDAGTVLLNGRNTLNDDGSMSTWFGNTGLTITGELAGDVDLAVEYDVAEENAMCRLNITVDGVQQEDIELTPGSSTVKLADNLVKGQHTITVAKGMGTPSFGTLYYQSVSYKGDLATPVAADLQFEFLGDSITDTAGMYPYNGEPSVVGWITAQTSSENVREGYAALTSKALGADFTLVSKSGNTIAQTTALLSDTTYGTDAITDKDVVVINLGTNDTWRIGHSSYPNVTNESVTADVKTCLTTVRAKYPNATIVWVYGMMSTTAEDVLSAAVEAWVTETKDTKTSYCSLSAAQNQLGGGNHPDTDGHEDAAKLLTAYLSQKVSNLQVEKTYATDRQLKIACVGDSITAQGYWNNNLQGELSAANYTVNGFGVSGSTALFKGVDWASSTSNVGKAYVDQTAYTDSLAYGADAVVIMLGTNDSKDVNWTEDIKDEFIYDYISIVRAYQNSSTNPMVFIALPPTVYNPDGDFQNINNTVIEDEIIPALNKVAAATGAILIDTHTPTADAQNLTTDGVHPNDAGKQILCETIATAIINDTGRA